VKPASQTPLSMLALAQILVEAGLPDGVLNLVTTSHSGRLMEPLIRDFRTRKLSFTGSTEVGRRLLEQAAEQVLRTSMELGGNAPFIVFDDADIEAAVDGAMIAKIRNMGEACTSANRFLVQESVAEQFTDLLTERMGALRVGRGTEDGVQVGPLINADATDKVHELVQDAISLGAELRVGGEALDGPGHFYRPTVLANVPAEARMNREEIFGPVAAVRTFGTEEQAVTAANDTEYGLVSYLYTSDLTRAVRVSENLETGMVGLNQGMVSNPAAPFGGVKHSGLGREGGYEGIREYLETKYVALAQPRAATT
jgi:succinate-semialdehyde dehydrogenase/glutarate-semialdehyde dehydrogenase